MNAAPDVLPWDHYSPELRDAVKDMARRFPPQMVADAAQRFADRAASAGHSGTDWVGLGWRDETEHHDFVAALRERTLRLPVAARDAVKSHRRQCGIPDRGPWTVEQALAIDLLIEEAELGNGERNAA